MKTTIYYHWEEVRADWVKGNRTDVKEGLQQSSNHKIFKIFREAVEQAHELNFQSGDIQDLREILKSLMNYEESIL